MSEAAVVPGWKIQLENKYTFTRWFRAEPIDPLNFDYETQERRANRYIAATYPARLYSVVVQWVWAEDKQQWWASATETSFLINEATGEHYKSGWRAERLQKSYNIAYDEVPEYMARLVAATHPHTVITVTEAAA
jgi:hypothetical protein